MQFTIILDFMILAPLGAILMPALGITPRQFGSAVSAYAFSAGISGILAAGFSDRFDRKSLLLFFYVGFLLGNLACGLAPNYPALVGARILTGLFGGVIGSVLSSNMLVCGRDSGSLDHAGKRDHAPQRMPLRSAIESPCGHGFSLSVPASSMRGLRGMG